MWKPLFQLRCVGDWLISRRKPHHRAWLSTATTVHRRGTPAGDTQPFSVSDIVPWGSHVPRGVHHRTFDCARGWCALLDLRCGPVRVLQATRDLTDLNRGRLASAIVSMHIEVTTSEFSEA